MKEDVDIKTYEKSALINDMDSFWVWGFSFPFPLLCLRNLSSQLSEISVSRLSSSLFNFSPILTRATAQWFACYRKTYSCPFGIVLACSSAFSGQTRSKAARCSKGKEKQFEQREQPEQIAAKCTWASSERKPAAEQTRSLFISIRVPPSWITCFFSTLVVAKLLFFLFLSLYPPRNMKFTFPSCSSFYPLLVPFRFFWYFFIFSNLFSFSCFCFFSFFLSFFSFHFFSFIFLSLIFSVIFALRAFVLIFFLVFELLH